MYKLMRPLIVICVLLAASFSVAHAQSLTGHQHQRRDASLIEEFSFLIKDFRMDHQTQTNNLNISISYRYIVNIRKSEYPDFRGLAKDVETLLANYPNKDDYWEIVNKQITALLLNKYPGLMSVTIDLKVDPSSLIPYTRSSRVTRERAATRSNRKRT
jgi:hypothetical protein